MNIWEEMREYTQQRFCFDLRVDNLEENGMSGKELYTDKIKLLFSIDTAMTTNTKIATFTPYLGGKITFSTKLKKINLSSTYANNNPIFSIVENGTATKIEAGTDGLYTVKACQTYDVYFKNEDAGYQYQVPESITISGIVYPKYCFMSGESFYEE